MEETKKCGKCGADLPATNDYFSNYRNGQLQSYCKTCQSEYRKAYYQENSEKQIGQAIQYKKSFIEWFNSLKATLCCKNCGEPRFWILDFHHRDPAEKDTEVSALLKMGNKKKILSEIEKCDVLCANCHRDLHYQLKQDNEAKPV